MLILPDLCQLFDILYVWIDFSLKSFGCLSKFYYFCIRFPLKTGYERCLDEFFEM